MGYKEFKEMLLERLQDFYGDSAEVEVTDVQKNNGVRYDGIQIRVEGDGAEATPVIRVEELYSRFAGGSMDMEGCVQAVSGMLKDNGVPESVGQIAKMVKNWDYVKENVFPILLSTEDNRELLQKLACTQMLDLSVAYIIRFRMADGFDGNAKINRNMLEIYGITTEQLHAQAMENLRKDGYEFQDMGSVIRNMFPSGEFGGIHEDAIEDARMYVLTNTCRIYGAAGILDKELLKKFARGQDYFILPSSIHETIFVPLADGSDQESLDAMVREVNAAQVSVEERLSDHSYYYDGRTGEIRMCA